MGRRLGLMLDTNRKEEPSMENRLYTFNKTIHGYRHIQESIPCQDYSSKYPDIQGEKHNESVNRGIDESILKNEPMDERERNQLNAADGCELKQPGIESAEVIEPEVSQSNYSVVATEFKDECEDESFHIVAVADGHGDPACHRSSQGSRFAVSVGLQCLKGFARAIIREEMPFEYPRQRSECMQQLTRTIIAKWHEEVLCDLDKNPIMEEDLAEAGYYEEKYRKRERLDHLYGTTLITALYVKDFLILIQQGDGRCDVFYQDGTIDQPIPWDARCKGSTTTSMCDEDAINSIRSKVIDFKEKTVVACFVGSDGVEDSYYDNEQTQLGTHRFYMDLVCKIHERGTDDFESYLDDMLPEFSKRGSADDVSVAGIVDLEKTKGLLDEYQSRVERYDRRETLRIRLEEANSKVISMTRKHGFLKEKIEEGKNAIANAQRQYEQLVSEYKRLEEQYKRLDDEYILAKNDLDEFQQESERISVKLREDIRAKPMVDIQEILDDIKQIMNTIIGRKKAEKEAKKSHLFKQLQLKHQLAKKNEEDQETLKKKIADLENQLECAREAFDEYDREYQDNKIDVERLKAELSSLEGDD